MSAYLARYRNLWFDMILGCISESPEAAMIKFEIYAMKCAEIEKEDLWERVYFSEEQCDYKLIDFMSAEEVPEGHDFEEYKNRDLREKVVFLVYYLYNDTPWAQLQEKDDLIENF